MKKHVWRVQNKEGVGPYCWSSGRIPDPVVNELRSILDHHNYSDEHPSPSEDNLRYPNHTSERFAFRSKTQVLEWFAPDELSSLKELGFHLVRRRAKITAEGRKQVLCLI